MIFISDINIMKIIGTGRSARSFIFRVEEEDRKLSRGI